MPKISVVVISYNCENIIEKILKSVLAQTCRDFELILVDKNSKDKTLEVAGQFKNDISKWISEPCKSDYDAMNKGILLAQGEYVIFLNENTVFTSNDTLEKILPCLNNDDIVYGKVNYSEKIINPDYKKRYSLCEKQTYLSAEFIKRSLLETLGGFDTRFKFMAGYEFNLRAILKYKAKLKSSDEIITNVSKNEEFSLNPKNVRRIYKEKKVIQRAYFKPFQIFVYKILSLFSK